MKQPTEFFERWRDLMSPEEVAMLQRAGMGKRVGFGQRPALLVVDVQNYMVGRTSPGDETAYPVACSDAPAAAARIAELARTFRRFSLPVVFTQHVAERDGRDLGIGAIKRGVLDIEGWYIKGTTGAALSPLVGVEEGDLVVQKHKPSAFHGTPLIDMLIARQVDTVVICGGSTSNCIRAAAIDAHAYDLRVLVVRDAVFDRVRISHEVSLMDIDRQLGDVVTCADVLAHTSRRMGGPSSSVSAHGAAHGG